MTRGATRDGRSSRLRQRRRSRSATSSSSGSDSNDSGNRRSSHTRSRRRHRSRSASSGRSANDSDNDSDGSTRGRRARRHGEHVDDEGLSFEHIEAIRGITLIKRNEYPLAHLPREKLHKMDDANAECFCTFPASDEPDKNRCEDVSCLNFATYIECSPEHCDAGKYCHNQRLQHPQRFPELEPFKTESKGFGVRARQEITQSTVIGEYVGEIIDEKELQRRLQTVPRHELNFYYLALEPGVYIDARNKGSFTRFMNHSCEPNCKTEKWTVQGETRIAVVAMRSIRPREELTFDYQWKSLGSKQIKCHCGAANCKGVIGSEVDANKTIVDTGLQGFYREPTKDECGEALVGRHIRLFLSASDTSVYAIATIRRFNADDQSYEVEYGDSVGTPEESYSPSSASPLSAIEELRSQPFVKLSERSWQLYVELDGLSSAQIQQAVFSIPKRRTSEAAATAMDSPGKTDSQATNATTSPSQSSTTPSSTPGGAGVSVAASAAVYVEPPQRDADGELLDLDGDIITNKLLIKGLPPKCTETLLRRMFSAPRHSQSASMLQRLQSSILAQRHTTDVVVQKLDLFFFDDASGWALVEFADPSFAKLFRKNLNARELLGRQLRVFFAGRKEVDNFERAKRNTTIRREETTAATSNPRTVSAEPSSSSPCEQLPPMSYPFGQPLDWLVNVDQVEDSPTRRKGISQALEEKVRSQYVKTVLDVTKRLRLDNDVAASAVLALHRLFTFRAMPSLNIEFMAAGMLHVYLKAHSCKFAWPEFVTEVYAVKYPAALPPGACKRESSSSEGAKAKGQKIKTPKLKLDPEVFKRFERQILETEMELLEGVLFDLSTEEPNALLESLTSNRKRPSSTAQAGGGALQAQQQQPLVPTDVHKEAKYLLRETLRLTVWAHTSLECVTLAIFYVSAAVTTALTFSGVDKLFEPRELPEFLPFLDPVTNEKDALALLECSLLIADAMRLRWLKLEKEAKAARLAAARSGGDVDFFDTEQFAVQRHKPVEISLRVSTLLKAWIDVTGFGFGNKMQQQVNRTPLKSLHELRHWSRDGVSETVVASVVPRIKVSEVLQRQTPGATSSSSSSRSIADQHPHQRVRRLHVRDVEAVQQIRKRTYLGTIAASVAETYNLGGARVYVQPWPYQQQQHQQQSQDRNSNGATARACVRELVTALLMTSRAPHRFLKLVGVVFPNDHSSQAQTQTQEAPLDFHLDLHSNSSSSSTSQLGAKDHFLAFEQPLHSYAGLLDAKVVVPMALRKRAIYDMLSALALCHEWHLVHRYVAPCHLFVVQDGIRLGGYQAVRKATSSSSGSRQYELSDVERKEHTHGSWLQVTPPEVLLGGRHFTARGDIWSAGCVALTILFDRIPFLRGGPDARAQLNLIYRLCGTPVTMWHHGATLPLYEKYKPKGECNVRIRKTLTENRDQRKLEVGNDAIDLLEAMLWLDPNRRMSARKLLEMPFFNDCRSQRHAVDFTAFPSTFDAQSRRYKSHASAASASTGSAGSAVGSSSSATKRRRSEYEKASGKSKRTSTGSAGSGSGLVSSDVEMKTTERGEDDDEEELLVPPLPQLLQRERDTNETNSDSERENKSTAPPVEKRVKLGWGMGLHQS